MMLLKLVMVFNMSNKNILLWCFYLFLRWSLGLCKAVVMSQTNLTRNEIIQLVSEMFMNTK